MISSYVGFGEAWEVPGSYIQLVGLLFLFLGTAVYDGKITLCDDSHEYRSIAQTDGPVKKIVQETSSSLTK
jgi:hypothetical protein